jgi:hypothetical protein
VSSPALPAPNTLVVCLIALAQGLGCGARQAAVQPEVLSNDSETRPPADVTLSCLDRGCPEGWVCDNRQDPVKCVLFEAGKWYCGTEGSECPPGLWCSPWDKHTTRGSSACQFPSGLGGICASHGGCVPKKAECQTSTGDCVPQELEWECESPPDCAQGLDCNLGYYPPQCKPWFSSGPGEPCSQGKDCMSGLWCLVGILPGPCDRTLGTCQPKSGQGGPCNSGFDCEGEALVCNWGYDPPACEPRHSSGVGDPCACGWGNDGYDKSEDQDCEAGVGLVCNCGQRRCLLPQAGKEGDPCEGPGDCEYGLICNEGYLPAKCVPCGAGGIGTPCVWKEEPPSPWSDGASDGCVCEPGLGCDWRLCPNVCTAVDGIPDKPEDSGWEYHCSVGDSWSPLPGECPSPGSRQEGEWCSEDWDCQSGFVCNSAGDFAKCLPLSSEGEPCLAPKHCVEGLLCNLLTKQCESFPK